MIVLSCKDICKSYGIRDILKNITFSINEGDKVGVIGPNGEGKSTLFKILTKELSQDSGEVFIDKTSNLGYLSQNLSLDSSKTIYEETLSVFEELLNIENRLATLEVKMNEPYDASNAAYHDKLIKDYTTLQDIYSHKGGYIYKGEISRVLNGLGFAEEHFDKEISTLSGGQKTRVALCKLLLRKPDILLLDEPTNHLDLEAITWLEEYLKSYKGTVLVISHDRFFLDSVTNKTFEVISGSVETYNVPYTKYIEQRKKKYEALQKAYDLQQAEIKRQEAIIEKFRSFNREKSIRAAESREKALEKMDKIDAPPTDKESSKIKFETQVKSGYDVLHIENLKKSYSDKTLFTNLSLDLKRGEKVALIGENGRGKTTLFKIIMDKIEPDCGLKVLGTNVNVGYYDQEQSNLDLSKTILDEVWDEFPNMTTTKLRSVLASFLFTGDDVFKEISKLSGGEKCRINLLKLMLSKSNLLLLDEPTNHLDNDTIDYLEEYLNSRRGSLIMITHDRYFLDRVSNRIIELDKGRLFSYDGNYSTFLEKKMERLALEASMEEKRQNLIRKELAWVKRGAKARTTKQKARLQRFDELVNKDTYTPDEKMDISVGSTRLGKKIIEIHHISKKFDNKVLIDDLDYTIARTDRIGIIGKNGMGKSTLIKILNGEILPDSGHIEIGETVKIGCFSQDDSHMHPDMRAIDYVKEASDYIETADGTKISASQMCEKFLFNSTMQYSFIGNLSGGERRRLHLLRTLMLSPNVLLLDEPTNDLDIATLNILEDYLDEFNVIVITVSHDRYFLDRICNKIFAYEGVGKIHIFTGNYSDYSIYREIQGIEFKEDVKESYEKTPSKKEKPKPSKRLKFTNRKIRTVKRT